VNAPPYSEDLSFMTDKICEYLMKDNRSLPDNYESIDKLISESGARVYERGRNEIDVQTEEPELHSPIKKTKGKRKPAMSPFGSLKDNAYMMVPDSTYSGDYYHSNNDPLIVVNSRSHEKHTCPHCSHSHTKSSRNSMKSESQLIHQHVEDGKKSIHSENNLGISSSSAKIQPKSSYSNSISDRRISNRNSDIHGSNASQKFVFNSYHDDSTPLIQSSDLYYDISKPNNSIHPTATNLINDNNNALTFEELYVQDWIDRYSNSTRKKIQQEQSNFLFTGISNNHHLSQLLHNEIDRQSVIKDSLSNLIGQMRRAV
jgi:hypothetical protein